MTITADGWTSRATKGFTLVTGHWLDEKFGMHAVTLALHPMEGSHTGVAICEAVCESLRAAEFAGKIIAKTHDNAANMVAAMEDEKLAGESIRYFKF